MNMNLLQIVNRQHLLPEDFVPCNLVSIGSKGGNHIKLVAVVWDAFMAMSRAAESYGQSFDIEKGYVSYKEQYWFYHEMIQKYGEKKISTSVAIPGASEHQLGLGIDISSYTLRGFRRDDVDCFKWVHENCHKFGFISRYKKEFTSITGVDEKPWHLRYVGSWAPRIAQLNVPLETFVEK